MYAVQVFYEHCGQKYPPVEQLLFKYWPSADILCVIEQILVYVGRWPTFTVCFVCKACTRRRWNDKTGVIAFGRSKGHSVEDVVELANMFHSPVKRASKQCNKTIDVTPARLVETRVDRQEPLASVTYSDNQLFLYKVTTDPNHQCRSTCPISERTLRPNPANTGLVLRNRPRLTPERRKARLLWEKLQKNCTIEDWQYAIWSNEFRFCFYCSDARRRMH